MSISTTSSPVQAATTTPPDDANLPKGHCRYILTMPELRGQRCGCTGFTHLKDIPGITCQCGHAPCYHLQNTDPPVRAEKLAEKSEIEDLKRRIENLERELDEQQQSSLAQVRARVSELEETVDKNRSDIEADLHANFSRVWVPVQQFERKFMDMFRGFADRLAKVEAEVVRLSQQQNIIEEENIDFADRLDRLECVEDDDDENPPLTSSGRPRRISASNVTPRIAQEPQVRRSPPNRLQSEGSVPLRLMPVPRSTPTHPTWTVHISLLPDPTLPFPFEKDTNAYKRCLSRGLHQMVVISGPDSHSFVSAVNNAFRSLLKDRPWMPLQARLCDAAPLQGLPMLRTLELALLESEYDLNFLREHCAVCDADGKIDSLYIAMRSHTLSWQFLKKSPVYKEGLEESWKYDGQLDNPKLDDESAGAIVMTHIPPASGMKRCASQMSRSSSFGSASTTSDVEASRQKIQRTGLPHLVDVKRRVETV